MFEDNSKLTKIMQPGVKMLLTQAVYEYIVGKYLSVEERDLWEDKFSQDGVTPTTIKAFINTIETKTGKSLNDLVVIVKSMVVEDTANIFGTTMIDGLALQHQKTKIKKT